MGKKSLIILLLLVIGCSENSAGPNLEQPAPGEFQVTVQDRQGAPYTCGFIQLTYLESSTGGQESQGISEDNVLLTIDYQGKSKFAFPENASVLIKRCQILDYLFQEIEKRELDIIVPPGELIEDTIKLDQHDNVDVYWERLDFSQNYDLTGKRILTIVGDDYDFMECQMITQYLVYFGAEMVITSNRLDVCSHYWLRVGEQYQSFPGPDSVTALLQNVDFNDFDGLFCPGGNGPVNLLREYPEITSRIYRAWDTDSLFICAICHGPLLLAESDIIDGRHVTGFPDIRSSLTLAGGIYLPGEPVVVDGNIQTGNWPHFNSFARSMAEILENW
jgi:protease I